MSKHSGSSPRVWGTLLTKRSPISWSRFIPTCVGNTVSGPVQEGGHPGSSPRVWGTQWLSYQFLWFKRFIPTCVGNTSRFRKTALSLTVHPHVCGEHVNGTPALAASSGSSPRVWGTRKWYSSVGCFIRFIPTCVGNTSSPSAAR